MDIPNPATSVVVAALDAVRAAVGRVADTLTRMEWRQSPGVYRITPGGASMPPGFPAQSTRLRVIDWVIAVSAAGTYGIRVGRDDIARVQFAGADTKIIPLPVTIDRAAEITTSGTAANIVDSFLTVYTE